MCGACSWTSPSIADGKNFAQFKRVQKEPSVRRKIKGAPRNKTNLIWLLCFLYKILLHFLLALKNSMFLGSFILLKHFESVGFIFSVRTERDQALVKLCQMPRPSWSFYRQSCPSSLGNDFEPQTVNQHSFCMFFFVLFLGQNKKSRQTGQLIGWNAEQISKRTFFFFLDCQKVSRLLRQAKQSYGKLKKMEQ